MMLLLKIANKNIVFNYKRTILTLIGVILSVSIIAIVCGIADSLMVSVIHYGDIEAIEAMKKLCSAFIVISCFMSCFTIYTTFSITFQSRIKCIGFLTSVGMSPYQMSALIFAEAAIYAVIGVVGGLLLGFGIAKVFFEYSADLIQISENNLFIEFVVRWKSVLTAGGLGVLTIMVASFFPILRMRMVSVTEIIKDNNQINISLKQTLLSKITEKIFGRLGLLAGQNYDNNKGKYRAISFALSGGATFFFAIYSFFMYPIRYYEKHGYKWDSWFSLCYPAIALAGLFVIVFLICSAGCVHQNMEQRKKEFAMYKSIGMTNFEIYKMMNIECIFFIVYSILFGLIGSIGADYFICNLFRITGVDDLNFYFPIKVFVIFVLLDIGVGLAFALYSQRKISKVNIIETIRNG